MSHEHPHEHVHPPPGEDRVKDPVCGMSVSPSAAKWKHVHEGTAYYFCNPRCAERFRADPSKYALTPQPPSPAGGPSALVPRALVPSAEEGGSEEILPAPPSSGGRGPELREAPRPPGEGGGGGEGLDYTCPMHPEIVRAEPGSCPLCGMALEPRTVSLDDAPSPELD